MRGTVVAVFAHPDDESFGPGGTLAKLAKTHDIYLITVTGGEAGLCSIKNPHEKLADIRKHELLKAAEILGIKKVFSLGYIDGTLSNDHYHEIASKLVEKMASLSPEIIITFDQQGVSGHLDHIAVSYITTFVVRKLKPRPQLWYYRISQKEHEVMSKDYFIYFPPGITKKEADLVIDISDVWDKRVQALNAHVSQRHDGEKILETLRHLPQEEYFTLLK